MSKRSTPSPRSSQRRLEHAAAMVVAARRALAAERGEVVLAEERVGAEAQQREVERFGDPPRGAGEERVGRRPVDDRVAVRRATGRRATGVERRVDQLGVAHHHLGTELTGRPRTATRVDVDVAGDRQRHDLSPRVHTGVGASRADERRGRRAAARAPTPSRSIAFDRARVRLRGEAVEVGAVVRDREPEHTVADCSSPAPESGSWVTPVRCAPWARCHRDAGPASGSAGSHPDGRGSAARSRRTACA